MNNTPVDKELLERERALFESHFPKPPLCLWTGVGYAAQDYNAWSAHEYAQKWNGWIARAKLMQVQ